MSLLFFGILRRYGAILAALTLLFGAPREGLAQRAIPDPAPINNFNPLCDSSLVHCLEIDHFAGHVYGHLQVLPKTDQRDAAAVFPFGVTLGLFGRVAGGISTYYAFWKESDGVHQQLGPLRLNLTARLLPLFTSGGDSPDEHPRRFQLGLAYEHELRVGPFSGSNALGLLTDLASFYLVGSKWLGPFYLSASIGAMFDWKGSFATGSMAGQFGWLIPGFRQLKVFVEGMGRGVPAYVKKDALPLLPDGQDPIHPQGIFGGGFAFRAHRRVDLGVEVQHGVGGDISPWTVSVSFLVISGGKEHEGQALTPVAQLAKDATVETARAIYEYIKSLPIDPYLDEHCILRDENGEPMMDQPVGTRTADGQHCLVQGEKLPMHEHWLRDKKKSVVCHDKKLSDCLMYRRPGAQGYRVLHRPWVGDDCVLRENVYDPASSEPGQTRTVKLAVLGAQTKDKKGCTDSTGHVHEIGKRYYREHGHLWVCDTPRIEEEPEHCFLALAELPQNMKNQATPFGRIARALDQGASRKAESIDRIPGQAVDTAEDVAEGRITFDTIKNALQAKAEDIAKHATVKDAKRWIDGKIDGVKQWIEKPAIEQGEDLAREAGDSMIPHPATVGAMVLTGGVGRGAVGATEELGEAVSAGKKVGKLGKRAEQAVTVTEHVWTRSERMSAAQLPHRGGKVRYVPPENWHPSQPLPRGPKHGYMDRFQNEWTKGPSRTAGEPFEWDVQLRNGGHWNVSLEGHVTH